MQYYNDKSNENAANVLFMFFQIFMLLIVYGFLYTYMVLIKAAIAKLDLTFMAALPEVIALVIYPVVIYRTLKMFKTGKRLSAVVWMMGWASVIIVFLYLHISQLVV